MYRYHLYLNGDLLNKENDLVINPVNITTLNLLSPAPENNLDKYKTQLFELDNLLKNLADFFKDDFDLSLYPSLESDINELESYVNNAGPGKIGADAKQTLYNIADTKQPIKIEIDS